MFKATKGRASFFLYKRLSKECINFIRRVLDEKNELSLDECKRIQFKEFIFSTIIFILILPIPVAAILLLHII